MRTLVHRAKKGSKTWTKKCTSIMLNSACIPVMSRKNNKLDIICICWTEHASHNEV